MMFAYIGFIKCDTVSHFFDPAAMYFLAPALPENTKQEIVNTRDECLELAADDIQISRPIAKAVHTLCQAGVDSTAYAAFARLVKDNEGRCPSKQRLEFLIWEHEGEVLETKRAAVADDAGMHDRVAAVGLQEDLIKVHRRLGELCHPHMFDLAKVSQATDALEMLVTALINSECVQPSSEGQ